MPSNKRQWILTVNARLVSDGRPGSIASILP